MDNSTFPVPYPAESLFHRLEKRGQSWRVYFHDFPQSSLIGDIWLYAPAHFRFFDEFLADAKAGTLASYTFIEPRFFPDAILGHMPNDEHPPHNVAYGEQLIAAVYNAVRSSPYWKQTLLVVTYDEHGDCYDHMPPPRAVPPDVHEQYGFSFDAYGVRVPAVIVSPYIAAGSKVRAPKSAQGESPPFDRTSLIATVRALFLPGETSLTARDAVAPDLLGALNLATSANDGPASLDAGAVEPDLPTARPAGDAPPNGMQASLSAAASLLPAAPPAGALPQAPVTPPPNLYPTAALAHAHATSRIAVFLGRPVGSAAPPAVDDRS